MQGRLRSGNVDRLRRRRRRSRLRGASREQRRWNHDSNQRGITPEAGHFCGNVKHPSSMAERPNKYTIGKRSTARTSVEAGILSRPVQKNGPGRRNISLRRLAAHSPMSVFARFWAAYILIAIAGMRGRIDRGLAGLSANG